MGNISVKINLTQFHSVIKTMPTQSGDLIECVVLPIGKNHFFKGDKGVYVDLIAFELKQKKEGIKDTHSIKQSFPKDYLDKLSQDEKNALPFIGGLIVWDESPSSEKPIVIQPDPNSDLPF
jgi:hypothetical protein